MKQYEQKTTKDNNSEFQETGAMKMKLTTAKIPNKQHKQHTTSVKPEEQ